MFDRGATLLAEVSFHSSNAFRFAMRSQEFKTALIDDVDEWTKKPYEDGTTTPFAFIANQILGQDVDTQIRAWEHVLQTLREHDVATYHAIHKGEPLYWLAVASYAARDFERALFYMDCALAEDIRRWERRWSEYPAGLFVMLNDTNTNQAALPTTRAIRATFDAACADVAARSNIQFDIATYREQLVCRAMVDVMPLRSAVTAFLSFLLEFSDRQMQLELAPNHSEDLGGTAEPFLLHLFKGCVLFETLLKTSDVQIGSLPKTLGDLLTCREIYRPLGFNRAPTGLGSLSSVDELFIQLSRRKENSNLECIEDILGVWALRNLIGHNLALPVRPSAEQYKKLFAFVFGAIARAILTLHRPTNART